MSKPSTQNESLESTAEAKVRKRILEAAFAVFIEHGYAEATTLGIATRAKVSKRELYALVGNKEEMLVACITERAKRMRRPADLPNLGNREDLAEALTTFGALLLREVSDPTVIAVFRLAISEAERAPQIAQTLDSMGREAGRAALKEMLIGAQSSGLLIGDSAEMAEQFMALLWGNFMVSLLLRLVDPPSSADARQRARDATAALLQLHPAPAKA
jgi:AcrR family transcriptional regulator